MLTASISYLKITVSYQHYNEIIVFYEYCKTSFTVTPCRIPPRNGSYGISDTDWYKILAIMPSTNYLFSANENQTTCCKLKR